MSLLLARATRSLLIPICSTPHPEIQQVIGDNHTEVTHCVTEFYLDLISRNVIVLVRSYVETMFYGKGFTMKVDEVWVRKIAECSFADFLIYCQVASISKELIAAGVEIIDTGFEPEP